MLFLARRALRRYSINMLKRNQELWKEINEYKKRTNSTGCSWIDLWTLYKFTRDRKPKEVLELGPGLSTLVISFALMENEQEGFPGRMTSMEENEFYYRKEIEIHPEYLKKYVDFVLCEKVEDYFYLFRGVKYKSKPLKNYDFVFVDGPTLESPVDGKMTFDYDLLEVVSNSENPIFGIIDYRLTTSFVCQCVFGKGKVKFDAIRELCFVGPVDKNDLVNLNLENLNKVFNETCSLLGNSKIRLT